MKHLMIMVYEVDTRFLGNKSGEYVMGDIMVMVCEGIQPWR